MVEFSALSTLSSVPLDAPRPPESAPNAARVTPIVQGDPLQPDRREQSGDDQAVSSRFNGRVAFTAKFGPDPETGLPLQIVRGKDVEAAENLDLPAIIDRRVRLALADGAVLGAQETREESRGMTVGAESAALGRETGMTIAEQPERQRGLTASQTARQPPEDSARDQLNATATRGAVLDLSI